MDTSSRAGCRGRPRHAGGADGRRRERVRAQRGQCAAVVRPVASTAAATLRRDLAPLLIAGFDERVHDGFSVDPRAKAPFPADRDAVYVLTHVDIVPTSVADGYAAVTAAAGPTRQEPGNLAFAAVSWTTAPNHLSLIEAWSSEKAFERHLVTSHTKTLRTTLLPITGALYDERLYSVIS